MTSASTVPCGIAIPQVFEEGPVDMGLVRQFAARAEALGYHSLWVQEQLLGNAPVLEPVSLLSYLAGVTRTIGLGSAVIILSTRSPVLLAKELGTVDVMSGGRLIFGTALGGRPNEYATFGGPSESRVTHFTEGVSAIKALWEQSEVSHRGRFWELDGAHMEPKPVQRPRPPIWFGGRHPDALKRAARLADGWMGAGSTRTEQFLEHVQTVKKALAELGRDEGDFAFSKRVYVALDDDEARAERRIREWFAMRYGNADLGPRVSIWGGAERCAEGLNEVVAGGAGMLMLNPMFDHMDHVERLNAEVIPLLRSA